jgi:hypothetical protein
MLHYLTLNTTIEIICLIISIVCLFKDDCWVWRSMIFYLLLICIAEILGIYIKGLYLANRGNVRPNIWVYNILTIFEATFISIMFGLQLSVYIKIKKIIVTGAVIIFTLFMYEITMYGFYKKCNLTTSVMAVIFVLYSLYYFYNLIKDDNYVLLIRSSVFWWVAGVLLFYFGSTICNLFYYKLSTITVTPKHYLTYYIYNLLNILLYGCWSYSFICRKCLTMTPKS